MKRSGDPSPDVWWRYVAPSDGTSLRVTDTATGAVREYESPLGRPFRPVLDTNAFATCSE